MHHLRIAITEDSSQTRVGKSGEEMLTRGKGGSGNLHYKIVCQWEDNYPAANDDGYEVR